MEDVIAWAGFFGAWLLVAGPLQQAAIELAEEGAEHGRIRDRAAALPEPPPVSRWWLVLPPVWFVLQQRRTRKFRFDAFLALTVAEREALVHFGNVATAWLYVAAGGFLIAAKETWELHEQLELGLADDP